MKRTTIDLPIRREVPLSDQCGHGKTYDEFCRECRIVSLQDSLKWMEPQVRRDRAELERLQRGLYRVCPDCDARGFFTCSHV